MRHRNSTWVFFMLQIKTLCLKLVMVSVKKKKKKKKKNISLLFIMHLHLLLFLHSIIPGIQIVSKWTFFKVVLGYNEWLRFAHATLNTLDIAYKWSVKSVLLVSLISSVPHIVVENDSSLKNTLNRWIRICLIQRVKKLMCFLEYTFTLYQLWNHYFYHRDE